MRAVLFCVPLLLATPAFAQTALTIGATGQAETPPDEAVAALTVQAHGADAATVQAEVNRLMAKALAETRAVPGVVATTGGYYASDDTTQSAHTAFQANQTLSLVLPAAGGVPSTAFATLLGTLQQQGLLMVNLGADLSAAGQTRLEQVAIADALTQIEAQAQGVAAQLHEHVGEVKTLSVNSDNAPSPGPVRMLAMAAAPPPQSAPQDVSASADVTAEIQLNP